MAGGQRDDAVGADRGWMHTGRRKSLSRANKPKPEFEKVDVYEGASGHIVLCQEWPDESGKPAYLRLMMSHHEAEVVATQMLLLLKRLKKK